MLVTKYKLDIKPKQIIEHAMKYGSYSERFTARKEAVSLINSLMGYCSRNDLNGVFKTELITAINKYDQVIFIATLYREYE